jgi:hypothetical protein
MGDEERDVRTDFLFAQPSFWSGVGRLLDLWSKFDDYNISPSAEEADMRALYSDWRITGQDVRDAWVSFHTTEAKNSPKRTDGSHLCTQCGKIIGMRVKGGTQTSLGAANAAEPALQRYWKKLHGREQGR